MENEKSLKAFTWSGIKVKYSTNIFISHNYKYNAYLKNHASFTYERWQTYKKKIKIITASTKPCDL